MNRLAALPVIGSAFLAACATTPDETSSLAAESVPAVALIATAAPPADATAGTSVAAVEADELDSGLVCESKRRPGSRIPVEICITREERAAVEERQVQNAQQYARDLDRERALKEQQGRMSGGRAPSVIVFQ
jgi:hypothetical protein